MSVSVVMAVRDGAPYLAAAVDSVLAEPEVTQFVVVDDGSTDETPRILAGYGDRLHVLRREAAGQMAALNAAIGATTGDLVSVQDADDLWAQGRCRALLDALADGADAAFGWIEQFASPDLDPADAARLRIDIRPQPARLLQTMLIRREALLRVGPLDEALVTSANIDWISRAESSGMTWASAPTVVLRRRIHASNLGRRAAATRDADLLQVMRAHLQRRRASEGSS
jgi:glycosyltransferase involved in cell wall biosynthesis